MSDLIESSEGGVATLTLNRPDSLNAFSDPMIDALLEAIDRLGKDPGIGAIVLGGAGRAFCAGGDVKAMGTPDPRSPQQRLDWIRAAHRVPLALAQCPKVTLARIQGAAMGAGLGLALCCDFRIVTRSAKFGAAFVKIGLSTDFGLSWQLPRLVGESRARDLLLTGDVFDAATAERIGLATRVVDDAALAADTRAWAERFARGPWLAQAGIKRNLLAAQTQSFAELLEYEATQQNHAAGTADHQEAVQAFLQKRSPAFQGR